MLIAFWGYQKLNKFHYDQLVPFDKILVLLVVFTEFEKKITPVMFGSLRNPLQSLQLNRTLKTRIIILVFAQIVFCKLLLSLVFVTRL